MEETKEMQTKIEEKLGLDPVDKSVVVLYEGEKQEQVRFTISSGKCSRNLRCLFGLIFSSAHWILARQACCGNGKATTNVVLEESVATYNSAGGEHERNQTNWFRINIWFDCGCRR